MAEKPKGGPEAAAGGAAAPRDRRASHRAAIQIPALLRVGDRDIDCTIRDLSTQGIALALRESLAPGMVVRVVFRLPNARQPVDVAGVLVRAEGGREGGAVGLQFVQPDADSLRAIETFVARNRSDQPFSRRRRRRGGGSLDGLYSKAVDDVAEKDDGGGGFFGRWRRRLGRRK